MFILYKRYQNVLIFACNIFYLLFSHLNFSTLYFLLSCHFFPTSRLPPQIERILSAECRDAEKQQQKNKKNSDGVNQLLNLTHKLTLEASVVDFKKVVRLELSGLFTASPH